MRRFSKNKIIAYALSFALLVSANGGYVKAAENTDVTEDVIEYEEAAYNESVEYLLDDETVSEDSESTSANATCVSYPGTNIGDNDYNRWYNPVYSYLIKSDSSTYMRVQGNAATGKIVATYFDNSFNVKANKEIELPLSIFGGFYASGDYYYIVSGQNNTSNDNSKEVIRVTRYDKNWKISGSIISIKGFNTRIPFDAACVRFTEYGDYIFVRSGHEMYSTHQANLNFSFNKNTMALLDSTGTVSNIGTGYVSHSFNQFIKMDGANVVAVDHGDAYPRSIVLVKYTKSATEGRFLGSAKNVDLISIPEHSNNNITGTELGGFEVSSSRYIAVGSSMLKNSSSPNDSDTKNIYVATCDKNLSNVTLKWITSYSKSTKPSPTNPFLVKLGTDSFLLIWSEGNTVKYVKLDGSGNTVGSVYSMSGELSDCQPVVIDNNVIWYTWDHDETTFYQIPVSSLGSPKSKTVNAGHNYVNQGATNGVATLICSICGDTKTVKLPTSYRIYWNSNPDTSNSYSSSVETNINSGKQLDIWVHSWSPLDADGTYTIKSSNSNVLSVSGSLVTALKAGVATITVQSVYNPSLKYTYTFTVDGGAPTLTNPFVKINSNIEKINATMSVKLVGTADVEYSWYISQDEIKWTKLADWKKDAKTINKLPPMYGECTLRGKARIAGETDEVYADVKVDCHPYIKGICQLPYSSIEPGQPGYLIGIESFSNPNDQLKYEMIIYDCTYNAWVYTTTPCPVGGNCLWTVWQPQYGYYWTLFRIYDANDKLVDEICYPFVNAF